MRAMQVTISLDARESALLHSIAARQLRKPKDQARFMLRIALEATNNDAPLHRTDNHAASIEAERSVAVP